MFNKVHLIRVRHHDEQHCETYEDETAGRYISKFEAMQLISKERGVIVNDDDMGTHD